MLALSLPPIGWWPLAYLAPLPLLWLTRETRPRRGALVGLVFGLVSFGLLLSWLLRFGELAWGALVVLSGLWIALFGALVPVVWRREHPVRSLIGVAALWTVIEWLRAAYPLGGFSWGQLGSTQVEAPTLNLASVTGVWGLSFLVVLVSGSLLLALDRWGSGARGGVVAPVLAAAALLAAPSLIRLPEPNGRSLDVATIQVDVGSVGSITGDEEDIAVAQLNLRSHATLAGSPPDLVVWGEGALDPGASGDIATIAAVRDAVARVGAPTLIGAVIDDPDGTQTTSTLAFDGRGELVDRYDKAHLVPFGEYVPWRSVLEGRIGAIDQIPVDRTAGTDLRPLQVPGLPPLGTPICYENSFPGIERALVREGAALIVLTINNASYGRSAASEQHLLMSRLRAVENSRWVVHAAISGISAFVDPHGQVLDRRELFEPAVMRREIRASTARTWYVRLGDWVPWGSLAIAIGAMAAPRRRRRSVRPQGQPLGAHPRVLVVLPTYDEKDTIDEVLDGVLHLGRRIDALVVDDGSPDGTGELVRRRAAIDAHVTLVERPAKAGLASAYGIGFAKGLAEGYDLVVEMDSDRSHRPDELHRLLDAAQEHDVVIGSRYVPGGSVTDWSPGRVALSKVGNRYARWCLGFPLKDATSGFRVYRAPALREITESPVSADGYGFQIELVHRAWGAGLRVGEVPITFSERVHGQSKISRRIVVEALWKVTIWGVRARLGGPFTLLT